MVLDSAGAVRLLAPCHRLSAFLEGSYCLYFYQPVLESFQ